MTTQSTNPTAPKSTVVGKTETGKAIRRLLGGEITEGVRTKTDKQAAQFLPSSIEPVERGGVAGYSIFIPRQPTQNDDQKGNSRITLGSSHGPKAAMVMSEDGGRGRLVIELEGVAYEVSYTATVMAQEVAAAKARRLAAKNAK